MLDVLRRKFNTKATIQAGVSSQLFAFYFLCGPVEEREETSSLDKSCRLRLQTRSESDRRIGVHNSAIKQFCSASNQNIFY